MFSKQHQLLAFADNICILARNARALTDAFNELQIASTKIGLQVNTSKTTNLNCTPRKVTLPEILAVKTLILEEPMFSGI
jgi:hypothetical protein